MAIGDLNVRIGATIKGLQDGLRSAERSLRGFARTADGIGNTLTASLSAPLSGLGTLSLLAAGDIEALGLALQSAFKNQGRTIEEANKELEALRQAAKAPGLDFEQAVRASIRLQSVAFSAEQARDTIKELANVVAASGGTGQNFESITQQFTQIIGKAKIMQEDIKIILENAPALASVFQEAFGGATAEAIRKTGVSARDFVTITTEGLAKLDRVQGGIANSFVNFRATVKNALATIGLELNKAFNVQGIVDSFADKIESIAQIFKNLDETTKRSTIQFALVALAIGPIIKGVALLSTGIASLVPLVKNLIAGFVLLTNLGAKVVAFFQLATSGSLGFSVAVGRIAAAFRGLNIALIGSVIGAIAIAATLAAAAFQDWKRQIDAASAAQNALKEVQSEATKAVAEEVAQVTELTSILKDEKRSKEERARALRQLQGISREYFGTLDVETSKTGQIELATRKYTEAILENARVQAARNKLVEIEGKLLDNAQLGAEAQPTTLQAIGNALTSLGNPYKIAQKQVEDFTNNLATNRKALESQRDALLELITGAKPVVSTGPTVITPTEEDKKKFKPKPLEITGEIIPTLALGSEGLLGQSAEAVARTTEAFKQAFAEIPEAVLLSDQSVAGLANRMRDDLLPALQDTIVLPEGASNALKELSNEFENIDRKAAIFGDTSGVLTDKLAAVKLAIENAITTGSFTNIEQLIELYKRLRDEITLTADDATVKMSEVNKIIQAELASGISAFAEAIGSYIAGIGSAAEFGNIVLNTLLNILTQVGKLAIETGVAILAIKEALSTLGGYGAIIAGVALIALAAAVRGKLNKQASRFAAFAEGGIVTSPTIGLVGEAGPEAIIPLRKFDQVVGGMQSGELVARVSGDDLWLIYQRAAQRKGRIG